MATNKDCSGGFKTRVATLVREVGRNKRRLSKLSNQERRSRNIWAKAYQAFMKASDQLVGLTVHHTKKEGLIKRKMSEWPSQSIRLTKVRDALRKQIEEVEDELIKLGTKLATLTEQASNEGKNVDSIVTQVFALNETVVQASTAREECLSRNVFPRLLDGEGNLRSQISFTSADGLRRVVAMVNTMTIVRGDLAAQAKTEIEKFFSRFQEPAEMDRVVKPLYDLTRQLLVEKIDFKVGPDLYRFIAIELDPQIFPELALAQKLLRQSIRSEKTNSYIRIYERKSTTDNWESVTQS